MIGFGPINKHGMLRISCEESRSQAANRELVRNRFEVSARPEVPEETHPDKGHPGQQAAADRSEEEAWRHQARQRKRLGQGVIAYIIRADSRTAPCIP